MLGFATPCIAATKQREEHGSLQQWAGHEARGFECKDRLTLRKPQQASLVPKPGRCSRWGMSKARGCSLSCPVLQAANNYHLFPQAAPRGHQSVSKSCNQPSKQGVTGPWLIKVMILSPC